jgi:hypothetical protein
MFLSHFFSKINSTTSLMSVSEVISLMEMLYSNSFLKNLTGMEPRNLKQQLQGDMRTMFMRQKLETLPRSPKPPLVHAKISPGVLTSDRKTDIFKIMSRIHKAISRLLCKFLFYDIQSVTTMCLSLSLKTGSFTSGPTK